MGSSVAGVSELSPATGAGGSLAETSGAIVARE